MWGSKQVDSLVELDLNLEVVPEKAVLRRQGLTENEGRVTANCAYCLVADVYAVVRKSKYAATSPNSPQDTAEQVQIANFSS